MSDSVSPDQFASALGDILDEVGNVAEEALNDGVKKGIRRSAKEWRTNAKGAFKGTGRYAASIRSRVDSTGDQPEAHAYSTMPGLPHLLEKGHATIGGGFVSGRAHIAPASQVGFEEAIRTIEKDLDEGLSR